MNTLKETITFPALLIISLFILGILGAAVLLNSARPCEDEEAVTRAKTYESCAQAPNCILNHEGLYEIIRTRREYPQCFR